MISLEGARWRFAKSSFPTLPLFRLWGAARTEIPAYGSGCFRGLGRDGMIRRAQEFTALGLKAIKMQAAHIGDWRQEVRNLRMVRDAVGPDVASGR